MVAIKSLCLNQTEVSVSFYFMRRARPTYNLWDILLHHKFILILCKRFPPIELARLFKIGFGFIKYICSTDMVQKEGRALWVTDINWYVCGI